MTYPRDAHFASYSYAPTRTTPGFSGAYPYTGRNSTRTTREYENLPFGGAYQPGTDVTVEQRYTFTGREKNPASALMYYRYRQYDARVGRFGGRDPLLTVLPKTTRAPEDLDAGQSTNAWGVEDSLGDDLLLNWLHAYGYTDSCPSSRVDPFGKKFYKAPPAESDVWQAGDGRSVVRVAKCEIVLLYGHGYSKPHRFMFADLPQCSRGGFYGCNSIVTNSKIKPKGRMMKAPMWGETFGPLDDEFKKRWKNTRNPGGFADQEANKICQDTTCCCMEVHIIKLPAYGRSTLSSAQVPGPEHIRTIPCQRSENSKGDEE